VYLNCDSCLVETRVRTGYHIFRTVGLIFPLLELGKNLELVEYREASGRAAETSGRMQVGQNLLDTVDGPYGNARRPNG
jgi:hypothetical protein